MNSFIAFPIVLAAILVIVSLLLDNLMGIFIICIVTCLFVDHVDKDKNHKKPE